MTRTQLARLGLYALLQLAMLPQLHASPELTGELTSQGSASERDLLGSFNPIEHLQASSLRFGKLLDPRRAWREYAAFAATTLALVALDPPISRQVRHLSEKSGLIRPGDSGQETRMLTNNGPYAYLVDIRQPVSANAFFWYLGEGVTSLAVLGGFAGHGLVAGSQYSIATAVMGVEALLLAGATVTTLKMLTGRESPARATQAGGSWQGFPGFSAYMRDQSRFYAYPSGHLTTAVTTMTVLGYRYPKLRLLRPAAYVAAGLLMIALINNRTHWASDFPVGAAIGYVAGTAVAGDPSGIAGELKSRLSHNHWQWQGIRPLLAEHKLGLTSRWVW